MAATLALSSSATRSA